MYPHKPSAYVPLDHYYQRFHEPKRMLRKKLSGVTVLDRAIITGDLMNNNDGCGCFRLRWFGITYYFVVGWHKDGYRVIVTGWPVLDNRTVAEKSDEWSDDELCAIEMLNQEHYGPSLEDEYPEYIPWSKAHSSREPEQ